MKLSFALGLISLAIAGVSADNPYKVPVPLNTNTMGAVIKAAGSPGAAAVDPTLTCDADYTLAFACNATTGPCTVSVATFTIDNCTLTTPLPTI
ncbi:hypothetical protein DPV78_007041 [Talaromyces pinophilus]|nr:hypothetical protein DPV78_007041 [Talaromyces pinophilus]